MNGQISEKVIEIIYLKVRYIPNASKSLLMDIPKDRIHVDKSSNKIVEQIGASIFVININPLKIEWHNNEESLLKLFDSALVELIDSSKDLTSRLLDNPDLVEVVTGVIARFHLNQKLNLSGIYKFKSIGEKDCWVFYKASVIQLGLDKIPEKIACVLMQIKDLNNTTETIDDFTNFINHNRYKQRIDSLTNRQKEVLILFGQGKGRKEIAAILELSVYTIEDHKQALYKKFNCNSTAGLASFAQRIGILK